MSSLRLKGLNKTELIKEVMVLRKAVKRRCIDCCCNSITEARLCDADDCPLYSVKQAIL